MTSLTLHFGIQPEDLPDVVARTTELRTRFLRDLAIGTDSWHEWGELLPHQTPVHATIDFDGALPDRANSISRFALALRRLYSAGLLQPLTGRDQNTYAVITSTEDYEQLHCTYRTIALSDGERTLWRHEG